MSDLPNLSEYIGIKLKDNEFHLLSNKNNNYIWVKSSEIDSDILINNYTKFYQILQKVRDKMDLRSPNNGYRSRLKDRKGKLRDILSKDLEAVSNIEMNIAKSKDDKGVVKYSAINNEKVICDFKNDFNEEAGFESFGLPAYEEEIEEESFDRRGRRKSKKHSVVLENKNNNVSKINENNNFDNNKDIVYNKIKNSDNKDIGNYKNIGSNKNNILNNNKDSDNKNNILNNNKVSDNKNIIENKKINEISNFDNKKDTQMTGKRNNNFDEFLNHNKIRKISDDIIIKSQKDEKNENPDCKKELFSQNYYENQGKTIKTNNTKSENYYLKPGCSENLSNKIKQEINERYEIFQKYVDNFRSNKMNILLERPMFFQKRIKRGRNEVQKNEILRAKKIIEKVKIGKLVLHQIILRNSLSSQNLNYKKMFDLSKNKFDNIRFNENETNENYYNNTEKELNNNKTDFKHLNNFYSSTINENKTMENICNKKNENENSLIFDNIENNSKGVENKNFETYNNIYSNEINNKLVGNKDFHNLISNENNSKVIEDKSLKLIGNINYDKNNSIAIEKKNYEIFNSNKNNSKVIENKGSEIFNNSKYDENNSGNKKSSIKTIKDFVTVKSNFFPTNLQNKEQTTSEKHDIIDLKNITNVNKLITNKNARKAASTYFENTNDTQKNLDKKHKQTSNKKSKNNNNIKEKEMLKKPLPKRVSDKELLGSDDFFKIGENEIMDLPYSFSDSDSEN